ncbi:MAG: hypothetical protein JWQ19_419 [Subtercola sp.]|nr:hypothetical protein [Subtercola sp.]
MSTHNLLRRSVTLGAAALILAAGLFAAPLTAQAATAPHITSGNPADGILDGRYHFQVTTDSADPVDFSTTPLPAGIGIDSTGLINGLPREVGDFPFTLTVSNGTTPNAVASYMLHIAAQVPPIFNQHNAPDAIAGHPYSFVVRASGSNPALSYQVTTGNLPIGLTLNASTGEISGIAPSTIEKGAFFTVSAFDPRVLGPFASHQYAIPVDASVAPTLAPIPDQRVVQGDAFSYQVQADGTPTPTYKLVTVIGSSIPDGLQINSTTGLLGGTITAAPGMYRFAVFANNGTDPVASQQVTLTVIPASTSTPTPTLPAPTPTPTSPEPAVTPSPSIHLPGVAG